MNNCMEAIGCPACILINAAQTASDVLPIDYKK